MFKNALIHRPVWAIHRKITILKFDKNASTVPFGHCFCILDYDMPEGGVFMVDLEFC